MGNTRPIDAFISYARSSSKEQAESLKEGLETFDRRWDRVRRTHVFLDDQSMTANASLKDTIEAALQKAGWLIVLLSESAAGSPWVNQEVAWWLANKSSQTMLLVQVDGVVAWAGQDFSATSTAVPPALRGALASEPRWVDLQWFARSKDPAADPQFEATILQLYCPIKGLDRAQAVAMRDANVRKTKRLARGAVAGLTVLALGATAAGVVAVNQARRATEQADIARAQTEVARHQTTVAASQALASESKVNTEANFGLAQLQAIQAFELNDNSQTRNALYDVSRATRNLTAWAEAPGEVTALHFPPQGGVLVGLVDGSVLRWTPGEHTFEPLFQLKGKVTSLGTDDSGDIVVASSSGIESTVWSAKPITSADGQGPAAVSHDGTMALLGGQLVLLPSGDVSPFALPVDSQDAMFTADDSKLIIRTSFSLFTYRVASARLLHRGEVTLAGVNPNHEWPVFARDGSALVSFQGLFPLSRVWMTDGDGSLSAKASTGEVLPADYAISDGARFAAAAGPRGIVLSMPFPCYAADDCRPDENAKSRTLLGLGNASALAFRGSERLVAAAGTSIAVWDFESIGRDVIQGRSGLPANSYLNPHIAITSGGSAAAVVESSTSTLTIIRREPFSVKAIGIPEKGHSVAASQTGDSFVLLTYEGTPLAGYSLDGEQIEPVLPIIEDDGLSASNGMVIDESGDMSIRVLDASGAVVLEAPVPFPMTSNGMYRTLYGLSRDGSQLYVVSQGNPGAPDTEVQIWSTGAKTEPEQPTEEVEGDLQQLIQAGCALVGRPLTTEEWDPSALGIPEPEGRACA